METTTTTNERKPAMETKKAKRIEKALATFGRETCERAYALRSEGFGGSGIACECGIKDAIGRYSPSLAWLAADAGEYLATTSPKPLED